MNYEATYYQLQADLEAIEKAERANGRWLYLADTNIDRENVLVDGRTEQSADYWQAMVSAAGFAAGMRAEEAGLDLTARLGRAVY